MPDDNQDVNPQNPLTGPSTKSVLATVLTLALLMTGFFWLGYWTAGVTGHALTLNPSGFRPATQQSAPASQQEAKPDNEQQPPRRIQRMVRL